MATESQLVVTPVCSARTLADGRPPMGIACAQQDLSRVYPLADDPERCVEDFLELAAEHALAAGRAPRPPGGVGAAVPGAQRLLSGASASEAASSATVPPMRRRRGSSPRSRPASSCSWRSRRCSPARFNVGDAEDAAITSLVQAEAHGDTAAGHLPDHGLPASAACRARATANTAALHHPGTVSIAEINPSSTFSLASHARHRAGGLGGGRSLPRVQCVRVRHAGNVLQGFTIELLVVSRRIPSDADCPTHF